MTRGRGHYELRSRKGSVMRGSRPTLAPNRHTLIHKPVPEAIEKDISISLFHLCLFKNSSKLNSDEYHSLLCGWPE